jgi:hypothetical protein
MKFNEISRHRHGLFVTKNDVSKRDAPDTQLTGYPAFPKAGYRISSRISGGSSIPDIRQDSMH